MGGTASFIKAHPRHISHTASYIKAHPRQLRQCALHYDTAQNSVSKLKRMEVIPLKPQNTTSSRYITVSLSLSMHTRLYSNVSSKEISIASVDQWFPNVAIRQGAFVQRPHAPPIIISS